MFNSKLFFPLYGVVVILAAVDSSPVFQPRIPDVSANGISSGAGEIFRKADSEKKLKFKPSIEDELFYEDYLGQPDYEDYIGNPSVFDADEDNRPTIDKAVDDGPRGKPPVIPAPGSDEDGQDFDEDRNDADEEDAGDENKIDQPPADDVDEENGTDNDERKPLDGEDEESPDDDETRDKSSDEDEEDNASDDGQPSVDEDEKGNDEEEKQEDDNQDEGKQDGDSNEVDGEEGDKVPDDDEDKNHGDEGGEDHDRGFDEIDENSAEENIPGFSGGFVLDTPFFNIRQITKYFQQLERALEHVFRQTMDEAILLNGTYANTTEEEVEIDGKKYLVQKSIIKSGDKNSSIYIEALSAEEGKNRTQDSIDGGL